VILALDFAFVEKREKSLFLERTTLKMRAKWEQVLCGYQDCRGSGESM